MTIVILITQENVESAVINMEERLTALEMKLLPQLPPSVALCYWAD